ncbi:MAG: aspartyl/asparaginyl beta-hydroxylase domain-containing protein [Arenimonas sp.]|nr:aspartyl/asparaginyl beta-hydroxylase domain-containing protein [Arenimonas sp.]
MNPPINSIIQAASNAASQGRWGEAERLWMQVLSIDPNHPQALYSAGVHAFKRGQLDEALTQLKKANARAPKDLAILISIARVLREQGNAPGEMQAIEAALAIDPFFLVALLAKAKAYEQSGQLEMAIETYRNTLKTVPNESQWPASLHNQLTHGRKQVQQFGIQFADYLAQKMGQKLDALHPTEAQRWREAGAIFSGLSSAYPSVCNTLQVPRLPAIPFFEREQFAWVEAIESKTEVITEEMTAVMALQIDDFKPYIDYPPGTPVNQWHELNHSKRWSSYFLWLNGQPQHEHIQHCPETAKALAATGMADIGGLCPNAMFSALAPHTHIPPHHGETNARLVVHLPLIVPDHCSYRVGFEHRTWKVGEVLIFDDSIEHEARNDSDELRVVLIFDVWNPLLSSGERDMVRELSAAKREFRFKG